MKIPDAWVQANVNGHTTAIFERNNTISIIKRVINYIMVLGVSYFSPAAAAADFIFIYRNVKMVNKNITWCPTSRSTPARVREHEAEAHHAIYL